MTTKNRPPTKDRRGRKPAKAIAPARRRLKTVLTENGAEAKQFNDGFRPTADHVLGLRKLSGLGRGHFAALIGAHARSVQDWERGLRNMRWPSWQLALIRFGGVKVDLEALRKAGEEARAEGWRSDGRRPEMKKYPKVTP